MPGRLARSPSPYLRQHAENPVDWFPWGDEAFEKARREDKPVFLSVGYSACHWCHVMAHESFEDSDIAAALNQGFVSVKVDREELPDVDETYMAAVQLATGRGGWPMSVFLTPDRLPFYAGTYYPPRARGGYPGFLEVLEQLAAAWRERRPEVERAAEGLRAAVEHAFQAPVPELDQPLGIEQIDACARALLEAYDPTYGGLGPAPKFPPHGGLMLLARVSGSQSAEASGAREALIGTLRGMAQGGIHDQVGGGFHRYSTDEKWLLPHFEKMLYDNGLLLGAYAQAATFADGDRPLFERARNGIVRWLVDEMTGPDGLFHSSLDADSDGEEGAFYTWSVAELRDALGDGSEAAIRGFGATEEGNFAEEASRRPTGRNVLHLPDGPFEGLGEACSRLAAARAARNRPALDDKSILAWNAMAIRGLALAGELEAARRCADRWLEVGRALGDLPHMMVAGQPHGKAYLEDLAWFADALLSLDEAGLAGYRDEAASVAETLVERFWDNDRGAFAATSSAHETLLRRSWPVYDGALPSASAVAVRSLIRLGETAIAARALSVLSASMAQAPGATPSLHGALFDLLASVGPLDAASNAPRSKISIDVLWDPPSEGGSREGRLVMTLPAGWHVNSHEPASHWLTPTALRFPGLPAEVDYPPSDTGAYEGRVEIPFRLLDAAALERVSVELECQPCTDDGCQMPQRMRFDVELPPESRP